MATYSVAEAARRSGFTIDALRYYEREGILPPAERTAAGHRVYDDADLGSLDFIRCLRDTGMPIERLRRYGQLCRDPGTVPQRIELLEEHAGAVARQLEQLREWQARLEEKLDWYRRSELTAPRADGSES